MEIKKLFNLQSLHWQSAKEFNKTSLFHQIADFDDKLNDGKRLRQIQVDKAKQAREEKKLLSNPITGDHVRRAKESAISKNVNKVKVAQTVAKAKRIGSIKRK